MATRSIGALPALAIFAKYPRKGRVKTRLEPLLQAAGCLQLYRALLMDTLERTVRLDLELFLFLGDCSSGERKRFHESLEIAERVQICGQKGHNLGERLWNGYLQLSRRFSSVVFLGADSPTLPLAYVKDAIELLEEYPVVLGPSEDGGYYLVGLSQPQPRIFSDIAWGTDSVLNQTTSRLKPRDYALLPEWYDVDLPQDVERLKQDILRPGTDVGRHTSALIGSL